MKQAVFIIHGGNTFDSYEAYLADLKAQEITLDYLTYQDWKSTLNEKLGENYEVIAPRMPNKQNAKYLEWRIWFTKFVPLLPPNTIFVGHSLGGIFLAKYLAEDIFPQAIKAVMLVAAPYQVEPPDSLADFELPTKLDTFAQQTSQIYLYHSQDDPVVHFSNCEAYHQAVPQAHVRAFTDRGHFNQSEFPELIADIQNL